MKYSSHTCANVHVSLPHTVCTRLIAMFICLVHTFNVLMAEINVLSTCTNAIVDVAKAMLDEDEEQFEKENVFREVQDIIVFYTLIMFENKPFLL